MKLLQRSCCGCRVKTGALVICYIALIQAVVPILNILSNTAPEVGKNKYFSNEYKRDLTWLGVVTIVVVAHALWGIYKSKASYMIPFLIYKLVIVFVFTMMLGFAPAIVDDVKFAFSAANQNDSDVLPCFIITILLAIAIEAYCLLILFSHYQNLRQAAFAETQTPAVVGFSTAGMIDPEAAIPYTNDLPKKSPPPPYAV